MVSVELDFIRTYASIQKRTAEFKMKLEAMRDMHRGCKLGVSETTGALYVDKPSIFQGAARWFYGQNRYVVSDYLHQEIMEKDGLIDLVVNLRDKCAELFMHCPVINGINATNANTNPSTPANSGTTKSTVTTHQYGSIQYHTNIDIIPITNTNPNANAKFTPAFVSENTRKVFKMLCMHNIELLMIVGYGLGVLSIIYQPDQDETATSLSELYKTALAHFQPAPPTHPTTSLAPSSAAAPTQTSEAVIATISEMQRRVKLERMILERLVDKFNTILKINQI
jgi:hypothetical protein